MLNSNTISSLAFLLMALAAWLIAGNLTEMGRFFPRVIATIMAFFCIIQLTVSIVRKKHDQPFAGVQAKEVFIMFAGIIAYVALMVYIGFIPSGVIFLSFFFWRLSRVRGEKPNIVKILLLAAAICFGFYLVFHGIFLVPLPEGIMFTA